MDPQQAKQTPIDSKPQGKQEQANLKNRPRPIDSSIKNEAKKKRKLLSFDDEIGQELLEGKQKMKRADGNENSKKKNQLGKQGNRANIEEDLKAEFMEKIQNSKNQMFEIDYSYWDGPSLVKRLKRKKGEPVQELLECCRLQLISSFQSLASIKANDLLMVIKDCIIPHKMTIAELEALELKTGKGDLLLNFKNFQIKDITLSVNTEGCMRIIERARYQKNITGYPFNTWREINID